MANNGKELWEEFKERSFFFKCVMVFLTLTSVTSLASVAEPIIVWRGFFRDAILTWRDWTSWIPLTIESLIGVSISSTQADVLILHSIFIGCLWRARLTLLYMDPIKNAASWAFYKKDRSQLVHTFVVNKRRRLMRKIYKLWDGVSSTFLCAIILLPVLPLVSTLYGAIALACAVFTVLIQTWYVLKHPRMKFLWHVKKAFVLLYINIGAALILFAIAVGINIAMHTKLQPTVLP